MIVYKLKRQAMKFVQEVLVNLGFASIYISGLAAKSLDIYVIEELSHFFIAGKEVFIKEAYVRGDSIVILEIRTHLIGYQVQELRFRCVINSDWRYVSQATIPTWFQMNTNTFKPLQCPPKVKKMDGFSIH
ncbi:hypothetical protein ACB092_09G190700 [Castanea dentata]